MAERLTLPGFVNAHSHGFQRVLRGRTEGAWGLSGTAAQTAYLTRTAYWAGRFHTPS